MTTTNRQSGTNISEVADDIYRINTPVDIVGGFSFNQYLVVDDEPLVFHTGPRKMFPLVSEAIASVMPVEDLRYISFSHFEADECGALNEFLAAAPGAHWQAPTHLGHVENDAIRAHQYERRYLELGASLHHHAYRARMDAQADLGDLGLGPGGGRSGDGNHPCEDREGQAGTAALHWIITPHLGLIPCNSTTYIRGLAPSATEIRRAPGPGWADPLPIMSL